MSNIGFIPHGTYLLVQVPNEYYEGKADIVVNEATRKAQRREYIERGDKMKVAAIGEDCKFVEVNDYVAIHARGMMEVELDDFDEPFILVRESEILGKFA